LLARDVVRKFGKQVRFESVDWGGSDLPARFGITRYPVVFVDDVLVAQPDDFGWYGAKGRYSPMKEPENQKRFQTDLTRLVEARLRGEKLEGGVVAKDDALPVSAWPKTEIKTLDGRALTPESLKGRVTVVEFWATWCPPCRSTLGWLNGLAKSRADRLNVIGAAIESEEKQVREMAKPLDGLAVAFDEGALAAQFGDVASVPTLFVFDKDGRAAAVFYGAPEDLHPRVEALLEKLGAGS
jgi:thiol-disulfide isomerase/thioredoxin